MIRTRIRSSAPLQPHSRAALLSMLVAAPLTAHADCATTVVGFRTIGFECTGFDPDGVRVTDSGLTGEIAPGARVEGLDAVVVADATTVINEGTVDADRFGVSGGADLTILNGGEVAGGDAAIQAGDGLVLRNEAGATVTGVAFGVVAELDPTVVNAGTIRGGQVGIDGSGDVVVRNVATGAISGGLSSDFAITLDNDGLIEGAIFPGFDATILNRTGGVIRAASSLAQGSTAS